MRNFSAMLLAGAVVAGLLISGCSSVSDNSTFTEQDAIAKYKSKYTTSDFPDKPGVWQTVYRNMGGKCCGHTVKMQVEMLIYKGGENSYIITFNEKWSSSDIQMYQGGSKEEFFYHQSKVKITPDSITLLGESGDPEPDVSA